MKALKTFKSILLLSRFGFVKLCDLITEAQSDVVTVKTDVFSTSYPHELIAALTIKIGGILFMKDVANET